MNTFLEFGARPRLTLFIIFQTFLKEIKIYDHKEDMTEL